LPFSSPGAFGLETAYGKFDAVDSNLLSHKRGRPAPVWNVRAKEQGGTMFDKIKSLLGGSGGDVDLASLPIGGYEKYLRGATYPLGVDDLIQVLKNNGAPSQLQSIVGNLDAKGKTSFSSQDDVVNSVKGELSKVM
jgi:uncharacterized protein YidB (DUF937 family)